MTTFRLFEGTTVWLLFSYRSGLNAMYRVFIQPQCTCNFIGTGLLYILTSIWVLCTPNTGRNIQHWPLQLNFKFLWLDTVIKIFNLFHFSGRHSWTWFVGPTPGFWSQQPYRRWRGLGTQVLDGLLRPLRRANRRTTFHLWNGVWWTANTAAERNDLSRSCRF